VFRDAAELVVRSGDLVRMAKVCGRGGAIVIVALPAGANLGLAWAQLRSCLPQVEATLESAT